MSDKLEDLLQNPRSFHALAPPEMVETVTVGVMQRWPAEARDQPQAAPLEQPSAQITAGSPPTAVLQVGRWRWIARWTAWSLPLVVGGIILAATQHGWLPRYDMRLKYWALERLDSLAAGFVYSPLPTSLGLALSTALLAFALLPDARRALRSWW